MLPRPRLRCYFSRGVQQVLVLNASFEPLNVCSVRRAHVLVYKGKAEVVEGLDKQLRSAAASFVWPSVIRLSSYVRVPRAAQRKISRRALFARDSWTCVYCGATDVRLTLDHVVPRSRGGAHVWENCVASCTKCNHRKADRLIEELGWTLRWDPLAPRGSHWRLIGAARDGDPQWATYLTTTAA